MANARIDTNHKGTWTAVNSVTGLVENVRVDPILNAVLVFGVTADSNVPSALNVARIDANNRNTMIGYNDTAGTIEALRCGSGGELLIKPVS